MYYNKPLLANILSHAILGSLFRITNDTWVEDSFTVHNFNGRTIKFIKSQEGLYYHDVRWGKEGVPPILLKPIQKKNVYHTDTKPPKVNKNVGQAKNIIMLNTIKGN